MPVPLLGSGKGESTGQVKAQVERWVNTHPGVSAVLIAIVLGTLTGWPYLPSALGWFLTASRIASTAAAGTLLVALYVAVFQLRQIRHELAPASDLDAGIYPSEESAKEGDVLNPPPKGCKVKVRDGRREVFIAVGNRGNLTAERIQCNLFVEQSTDVIVMQDVNSLLPFAAVPTTQNGQKFYRISYELLDPHMVEILKVVLEGAPRKPIEMTLRISQRNRLPQDIKLTVEKN